MTRYTTAALCALALLLTSVETWADTMPVAADSSINLGAVNQINGSDQNLPVRNTGAGGIRHAFLTFDLGALPPSTRVARATLRLWVSTVATPGNLEIRRVSDAWQEATITAANAPATGALVANASIGASDLGRVVSIDVTALAQDWLNGGGNNGLAIRPDPAGLVRVAFDSRESVGHGPELEIVPELTRVDTGVGLLGGPVTSTGTISLDTGFTDGRYAQLLSPNTFSGQQVFNNTIGSSAVVGNTFSPLSAYGLLGYARATSGSTSGVTGASLSTSGVGVAGIGEATIGVTTGVRGTVASPAGTAGVFDNGAGGRLLFGSVNGVARFRVEGDGSIHNAGGITADGTITAPSFVGDGSQLTNIAAVREVSAGAGLLGGPVTSTGTISLDTGFTDGRYAQLSSPNMFTGQQVFNNTIGSSAVVGNTFSPLSAYGLLGYAQATSGDTSGVTGASLSTSGVGVAGVGEATSGVTTGVRGTVASPAGTAGVFDNGAGGRLLFGSVNGVARFRVEGDGSVHNTGGITADGTVTAPFFVGDGSQLTNIAAVREVSAGAGLLGGPVTSTGTISLDTGFTDGRYAQLLSPNTFSGQQVFNNTIGSSAVVGNTFSPLSAYGLLGYARATSGSTSGVTGASLSTSGVGVAGIGEATSGVTTGVRGTVASAAGTAGVFDNGAAGRLLFGSVNGVARFRVEGDGSIHNTGGITADGTITAPSFVGDGSQLTNIAAVREVSAGAGLLGGPVTSTGTISLDTGFTDGRYAQLSSPNMFTGQQVFNNTIGSSAVVGNTFSPLSAYGLLGYAQATSGDTSGVTGASLSTSGVGVAGIGEATSGVTTGVRGTVASAAGTAGVFDNGAGGAPALRFGEWRRSLPGRGGWLDPQRGWRHGRRHGDGRGIRGRRVSVDEHCGGA
jgi:hypothetical protein